MSSIAREALVCAFVFLVVSINDGDAETCDETDECKTGSCNSTTGNCICNLPHPSTILDGDRPFQGGKWCDETVLMCDGTNSFWCEHGGKCDEIVQGESYKCKCQTGYSGEHCELTGTPCGGGGGGGGGGIFCFHGATCLAHNDDSTTCDCTPGWKGFDCSVPTAATQTDSSLDLDGTGPDREGRNNANWLVVVVAVLLSLVAVTGGMIYFKKFFSKNDKAVPKFQQLSKMQSRRILDDDEEDNDEESIGDRNPVHNRQLHN